jgi:hypothetical protein
VSGTWGAPTLPPGRDDFRARQKPDVTPVDDLSRFVIDAITRTENAPKHDVPQAYHKPAGPIAHRYAADMRADMVAFRRIVAEYCDWVTEAANAPAELRVEYAAHLEALRGVMTVLANRFDKHPGFRDEWRLE